MTRAITDLWNARSKINRLASSLTLVAGACAAFGCAAEDEHAGAASGALSVVERDDAAGALALGYQEGERTIRYEMRLGPAMETPPSAEDLAINPDLPTHEVDVRVLDADGKPFVTQMGGHAFIDPSWGTPIVEDFDEAGRRKDFELLAHAAAAFRALDVPARLEQFRRTGIQIGAGTSADPDKPELADRKSGLDSTQGAIAWGPSSVVKWDFVVRKKPFGCCGVGDHSAVTLRGWSSSNSIVFQAYSCNHGTCASDTSVMGVHCVMSGFKTDDGTHSRYFYPEGCSTSYNVTSVWGHNCNDDSELQGRAIWYDSPQSTSGGSCNSVGPHNWAPGCSY